MPMVYKLFSEHRTLNLSAPRSTKKHKISACIVLYHSSLFGGQLVVRGVDFGKHCSRSMVPKFFQVKGNENQCYMLRTAKLCWELLVITTDHQNYAFIITYFSSKKSFFQMIEDIEISLPLPLEYSKSIDVRILIVYFLRILLKELTNYEWFHSDKHASCNKLVWCENCSFLFFWDISTNGQNDSKKTRNKF